MSIDKKALSERDICTKYITPAIQTAGWDIHTQVREELYFTKGRVIVRGKTVERGAAKFADYVLYHHPDMPLAIVEAKVDQLLSQCNELSVEVRKRLPPVSNYTPFVSVICIRGNRAPADE